MNLRAGLSSVLLALWAAVSLLSDEVAAQTTKIANFTLNGAPGDTVYLGHISTIMESTTRFTTATPCTASFTSPSSVGTTTIEVRGTDATVLPGINITPYVVAKLAADAVGIYKYKVACTDGTGTITILGTIVSKITNFIRENSTQVLKWNVDASFVNSTDYVLNGVGFWPVGLVEGNNLKISQDPSPSKLMDQFISTVRPLVLYETVAGKPQEMATLKFKFISMACLTVPAGDFPECLFVIKEDLKTAITFNYKLKYNNDYRFIKNREVILNSDATYIFQDCFAHSPNNAQNIYCYYVNTALQKTKLVKFIPGATSGTEELLNFKILDTKIVGGLLCMFVSAADNVKKLGCINAMPATMSAFSFVYARSVEILQISFTGTGVPQNCRVPIIDLLNTGGFTLTLQFSCDSNIKVLGRVSLSNLATSIDADGVVNLGQALPLDATYTRMTDASLVADNVLLCGNEDHAIFLTNSNTTVTFQGIRNSGQMLKYKLDGINSATSVDKVVCTNNSIYVKITTPTDSYVVDINTMGRGMVEWQRVNQISKLVNTDTFDSSEDGNFALIYKKNPTVSYSPSDILEYNRILAFVKVYDDTVTAAGTYSSTVKITAADNSATIARRYEVNYFTSTPNIALKNSLNDVPRGSKFSFYDFYDVSGPYQKIELDTNTTNQDIVQLTFNVDPGQVRIDDIKTGAGAQAPRFVLNSNFYVDMDNKTIIHSNGTSTSFSTLSGVIVNPRLVGITDGESGDVACLYDANSNKTIQFLYLNGNNQVKVSAVVTLVNETMQDYFTKGFRWNLPAMIVSTQGSENEYSAYHSYITYTFDAVAKEYTFNTTAAVGSHSFNRSELSPPKSYSKYVVQTWNDPNHAHCPVMVFSDGDLVKPFDFRICSLPTAMYAMFSLKSVTLLQPDKIRLEIFEGTQSKEFGTTVNLYTVEATMLEAGSLAIPNNIQWSQTSTRMFRNWAGGLVSSFIETGDEVLLLTRAIQPWTKMIFGLKEQNCTLSMFKKSTDYPTHQARYLNCSSSGAVRPLVSRYGSNIRVIQVSSMAGYINTTISDLQIKPQEIQFKAGISATDLKGINFVFNKNVVGSEVKVPVSAYFTPPATPSSSSSYVWVWVVIIVLVIGLIGGMAFYLYRREQIRRKTLVDQMMAQDPYATEVTETFPNGSDGDKPPSTVHEF